MSFAIPAREYKPHYVVITHTAKNADCSMTANAEIQPSLKYWQKPMAFKGSIRMAIPAARLDPVKFIVAPGRCAGATRFSLMRFDDFRPGPAARELDSDLYAHLMKPRRVRASDELYDVAADGEMRDNRIAGTAVRTFEVTLRSLFEQQNAVLVPQRKIDPEELKKLRALGYLQ
ncbi:MAG TPA: hypothetical protein VG323_19225 [Thermoanaerobaculia bacterium]|nr:hypothetical protein [Thermoanaerobaculia bacterium]